MVARLAPCAGVLLAAALSLTAGHLAGQAVPNRTRDVTARRGIPAASAVQIEAPPVIDGKLDEAIWQQGSPLTGFVQREPQEGEPASERTELRILYDQDALYVGAWLFDQQTGAIVLGETRRDAELKDADALLLIFDTYLDRQNGFVFGTTPAGIEYDGQVTREGQSGVGLPVAGQTQRQQQGSGGGFNKNWDGSWQVATSRDGQGWYAEFRIPFSTLRYGRAGLQQWGLNAARRIRRRNEEALWAAIPRQFDLYRVSQAGRLELQAPATHPISLTPYVLGYGRRDYSAGTATQYRGDVGGDAKVGLSASLTLDLTVNTDFAQVEVDEQQINLTRFALFFPEKRPFFLENAGTFSVGTPEEVELFFSRRIGIQDGSEVPITAGGRLTGKAAGFTLGLLDIQTQSLRVAGQTVAPANNYSAVRVIRELPNRSRVGAILVNRLNTDDTGDHNLTYGIDARVGIGQNLALDGYAARTNSPDVSGPGYAASMGGNYNTSAWTIAGVYREVQEGFNPEVGFMTRSEYRFLSGRLIRKLRFPSLPWFRELRPHITYREFFDLDGFSATRLVHFDSHFELANGAFFQLPALNFTREGLKEPFEISPDVIVPPGTYDNAEWGFQYNTNLSAPVSLEGRIDIGGFYSGHRKGTNSTLNLRIGETFSAGLRVSYYDVDLREGSFHTSLVGLRAAYAFTPRVYLQSLLQYNNQTRNFSGNVRLGWLSTAGTGLFVVYNDIEHHGSLDTTQLEPGPLDRTLIIKFTRLFELGR
ncbi:MAG: DUF5916 domain-containing protein [Longimicrobiales bacterium]